MYPPSWASLSPASGCLGIVGIYADKGSIDPAVEKNYAPPFVTPGLAALLLKTPADRIAAIHADVVEIAKSDSALYIRARHGGDILAIAQYENSEFHCKDGWLVIPTFRGMNGTGNVVLGYGQDSTMLHTDIGGALILKDFSTGAGLAFLVLPVAGSSSVYYRFPRRSEPQSSDKK